MHFYAFFCSAISGYLPEKTINNNDDGVEWISSILSRDISREMMGFLRESFKVDQLLWQEIYFARQIVDSVVPRHDETVN